MIIVLPKNTERLILTHRKQNYLQSRRLRRAKCTSFVRDRSD